MRLKSASVNALGGNRSERHKAGVGLIHHVSSPQTKQRLKCAVLFFRLRFFFLVGILWYIFFWNCSRICGEIEMVLIYYNYYFVNLGVQENITYTLKKVFIMHECVCYFL